jgi:hypothetical protein
MTPHIQNAADVIATIGDDSCFLVKCILRNRALFRARRIANLPPFHFPFSIQPNGCAEAFS